MEWLFDTLLGPAGFEPHGHCYLWQEPLVLLYVISDALIAVSYYSIPLALAYFVHKREDLAYKWIFLLFGLFIFACGTTHVMGIWTIWYPAYWMDATIKASTAGVSLATAVALWPLLPRALALPSPERLRAINESLQREIAERERIEQALLREQQFNRTLLENLAEGVLACDGEGRLRVCNRTAREWHGAESESLPVEPSSPQWRFFDADGKTPLAPDEFPLVRAFGGERVRDTEMTIVAGNQPLRAVLASGDPLFDPAGNKLGAVVVMHDITERKRTVEFMRRSLTRIQALREIDTAISSTLDLCEILDILFEKIHLFVPQIVAATVRLVDPHTGKIEPTFAWNLDQEKWKIYFRSTHATLAQSVLVKSSPLTVEDLSNYPVTAIADFASQNGNVSYLGVPLLAKDEKIGVLGFFTKVKHRFSEEEVEFLSTLAVQAAVAIHNSQLYEQIKRQAAELDEANRIKSEFLSVMSHELRTPLNAIMGYTGLMTDEVFGSVSQDQQQTLTKITAQAASLLGMVSKLLQVTQIEAQAVQLHKTDVNVCEFLERLEADFDLGTKKNVRLEWDCAADIPSLRTDEETLQHILCNLIGNAIKFTEEGRVRTAVRWVPERGTVEFEVSDTGIGICDEEISKIFDMFRQADSSETRRFGGTGVGLYIVKKFTELLGGTVSLHSEPGKGSTFTVSIPQENTEA